MALRRLLTCASTLVTAAAVAVAVPAAADAATPTTPSWVSSALADQYRLGDSLPLRDAPWWGTHNSFNSTAEEGVALSALDPNQRIKLTDQLDLGANQLELDVHWVPSLRAGGKHAPVVCHAESGGLGCSTEKLLGQELDEIAGWLRQPAHSDRVLLLYLEDDLSNQTGYDTAGQAIATHLGNLVYKPPAGGCSSLPLALTRDRIRASGARVLIVTNSCGAGTPAAWQGQVFNWSHTHLEAQPVNYTDYPTCGPDFTRAQYDSTLVRYFEELGKLSTLTGAGGHPITPTVAAQMQRCGVDLVSLDFLTAGDARLPALVWSWAPNEPSSAGACAIQRADARWVARSCGEQHPVACRAADGSWHVTSTSVAEADAAQACGSSGTFAVPRTGYDNQLLRASAGTAEVWINRATVEGDQP